MVNSPAGTMFVTTIQREIMTGFGPVILQMRHGLNKRGIFCIILYEKVF